ncbi:MAG: hypothetical protein AABP62_12300 [Planctomycetota bacterium]
MAVKKTGKQAASAASKVLKDGRTGSASKTAAGSALRQRATKTGKQAVSEASKVLKDGRTGSASKTAAGSALSKRATKDEFVPAAVQNPPRIQFSNRDGLTVIEPSLDAPLIDPSRVRQLVEEGLF